MKNPTRYNKVFDTRPFKLGGMDTIDLPRGLDTESLHFYLHGSVINTVAWATVKTEGLANLIKKVEILLDGESIATITGTILTHGNFVRAGGVIKTNPGVAIGTFAGVEVVGFLDFANLKGIRPKDTNLRTQGAISYQARITWGVATDLFTGAGASTFNLSLTTSIRSNKDRADANGYMEMPEFKKLHRFVERPYLANAVDRIALDPNMLHKAIVLRAESLGDVSLAVINNIRVEVGSDVVFDLPAAVVVDENAHDNGWALPVGYYVVDFAPAASGLSKISDFLDLTGRSDAFLVLDVVGGATNKVQIVTHSLQKIESAIQQNRDYHQAVLEHQAAQ